MIYRERGERGPTAEQTRRLGWLLHAPDPAARRQGVQEILHALESAGGNRTHAAARLGVPLRTLFRWLALQEVQAAMTAVSCSKSAAEQGTPDDTSNNPAEKR